MNTIDAEERKTHNDATQRSVQDGDHLMNGKEAGLYFPFVLFPSVSRSCDITYHTLFSTMLLINISLYRVSSLIIKMIINHQLNSI